MLILGTFVFMSMLKSGICEMSSVKCEMSNAYVDPWDMLNKFCFHVYAQMLLFMGEIDNAFFWTPPCPVSGHMSHVTCHMSYVKCLG